ncbi:MAG TPA: CcdC protein domain-containing protein [Allosphingosinicella sp.]
MQPGAAPHPWIGYAITAIVVAVVLAIRWRRAGVARPLHTGRLWIVPAIYGALTVFVFAATPPDGLGWLVCAAGLAAGAGLGWQRGRMMHIEVDPQTRAVKARQSPAAILFILVLVLLRSALRAVLEQGGVLSLATLTDALVAFALGLLAVQRLEMYLRARRLIDAAETG